MTLLPIVARHEWGARVPKCVTTVAHPSAEVWLHHTVTGFGMFAVQNIQNFHMDDRNWCDIGYNWIVDPRARLIYQGRGIGVRGAHTPGHNNNTGIAVLGNWQTDVPTDDDLETIAEAAATIYAVDAFTPHQFTGAHRDVDNTVCPGQHLYDRLPELNVRITQLIEGTPMTGHDGTYSGNWNAHKANLPAWAVDIWDDYVEAGGTSDPATFERIAYRFDLAWIYATFIAPLEARVAELEANPPGGGGIPAGPHNAVITFET